MSARVPLQASLFDRGGPDLDPTRLAELRRTALDDTAWVEHLPGFVTGQGALMDELIASTRSRSEQLPIYDRMVDVPRLVAGLPDDGPGHPLIDRIRALLSERYRTDFARVSLGYYRDGSDSVAWHGDRVARTLPEALVATVSLGGPRRFLLRPRGRSVDSVLAGVGGFVRDGRGVPADLAACGAQGESGVAARGDHVSAAVGGEEGRGILELGRSSGKR